MKTEIEKLEKELQAELAKRERMQLNHMKKIHAGTHTRASTTTHNANASRVNERIVWLRQELKRLKSEVTA
jgi:uncharacterized small protein (DUF1192 family)